MCSVAEDVGVKVVSVVGDVDVDVVGIEYGSSSCGCDDGSAGVLALPIESCFCWPLPRAAFVPRRRRQWQSVGLASGGTSPPSAAFSRSPLDAQRSLPLSACGALGEACSARADGAAGAAAAHADDRAGDGRAAR